MKIARILVVLALAASLAHSQQNKDTKDLKPPTDDPPVGKAPLLLFLDFEGLQAGKIPPGFTKQGEIGVDDTVAHSGRCSLKVEPAMNGPRRITSTKNDALAALGGQHWGRLFFRV